VSKLATDWRKFTSRAYGERGRGQQPYPEALRNFFVSKTKMKIAIIRRIVFASVFFIVAAPAMATGNEIDGFRLGMTMEQVMKVAAEKGYSLGKALPGGSNWTSYFLSNGGPAIAFCGNVLSWAGKTSNSNLHAFTHLLGAMDEVVRCP
jgi:hypothetical protein